MTETDPTTDALRERAAMWWKNDPRSYPEDCAATEAILADFAGAETAALRAERDAANVDFDQVEAELAAARAALESARARAGQAWKLKDEVVADIKRAAYADAARRARESAASFNEKLRDERDRAWEEGRDAAGTRLIELAQGWRLKADQEIEHTWAQKEAMVRQDMLRRGADAVRALRRSGEEQPGADTSSPDEHHAKARASSPAASLLPAEGASTPTLPPGYWTPETVVAFNAWKPNADERARLQALLRASTPREDAETLERAAEIIDRRGFPAWSWGVRETIKGLRASPQATPGTEARHPGDYDVIALKGRDFRYPQECFLPAGASVIRRAPLHEKDWSLPRLLDDEDAKNHVKPSVPAAPPAGGDVFEQVAREAWQAMQHPGTSRDRQDSIECVLRERFGPLVEDMEKFQHVARQQMHPSTGSGWVGAAWVEVIARTALAALRASPSESKESK